MNEVEIQKELEFARMARDILESIPSLIAVDANGDITYINSQVAQSLNRDPQECIGKPADMILPITKLKVMAQRMKTGEEKTTQFTIAPQTGALRNRVTIYREGKRIPGNEIGVVAYDAAHEKHDVEELMRVVELLSSQNAMYRDHLTQVYSANRDPDEIIGASPSIHAMKDLIKKIAVSSAAVCIVGETGTGKELVANSIHKLSNRADKPFVKINCAAIPKDLIESELFGYEPGAFTGASRQGKLGKFEVANEGTLLLDEIGEMPLALQSKLLRVIQSQEVERVGGTTTIPINVRLLCSTNRDLRKMVNEGSFRSDLYYRINTIEVAVPPLRKRLEDIQILCSHFISEANRKNGLSISGISHGAYEKLICYSWPGNIRELEHAIERACILRGRGVLQGNQFTFLRETQGIEPWKTQPESEEKMVSSVAPLMWNQSGAEEKEAILNALTVCRGRRSAAAELLGVSRSTLYLKMKKYDML